MLSLLLLTMPCSCDLYSAAGLSKDPGGWEENGCGRDPAAHCRLLESSSGVWWYTEIALIMHQHPIHPHLIMSSVWVFDTEIACCLLQSCFSGSAHEVLSAILQPVFPSQGMPIT